MRLACISDVHSGFDKFLPGQLPDADACVVAGDITDSGMYLPHEVRRARRWLGAVSERYPRVWFIFGNHDILMTEQDLAPIDTGNHSLRYLKPRELYPCGESGLTIAGANLSPCFDLPDLARMWRDMTADPDVDAAYFDALPAADIVVSHCPPYKVCDRAGNFYDRQSGEWADRHVGSPGLLRYIERHQPRLVVCGHIHECGGQEAWVGETQVVNAAQRVMMVEAGR